MNQAQTKINDALKKVRNRYLVNAVLIAVIGVVWHFTLTPDNKAQYEPSSLLFTGFFVGFILAGIVVLLSLKKELGGGEKESLPIERL